MDWNEWERERETANRMTENREAKDTVCNNDVRYPCCCISYLMRH
jgi:hypothetical protein